ncbi:MAG: hypothetical protein ACHQ49_02480 [Elusimicrobiota bacterium]
MNKRSILVLSLLSLAVSLAVAEDSSKPEAFAQAFAQESAHVKRSSERTKLITELHERLFALEKERDETKHVIANGPFELKRLAGALKVAIAYNAGEGYDVLPPGIGGLTIDKLLQSVLDGYANGETCVVTEHWHADPVDPYHPYQCLAQEESVTDESEAIKAAKLHLPELEQSIKEVKDLIAGAESNSIQ